VGNPIKIIKIAVIVVVIVVLSAGLITIINQFTQQNETMPLPKSTSSPIPNYSTKSESKVESKPVPVQTEPVPTEPVQTVPHIDCSDKTRCITGKVTKIVDGDTIDVNEKSIRFALISAPELGTSSGEEARRYIEKICPVGSDVVVDEDDGQTGGSYGRTIAEIYCNGISLNESILAAHLATIYSEFCSVSEFSKESWAQHGCSTKNQVIKPSMPKEIQNSSSDVNNCDPSYPDVCITPYPPDLDCKQVPFKNFRVLPPDPHKFDVDKDGIGCEGQ